jgi:hypothetical protein
MMAALDYTGSAELMSNPAFTDRVKIACLKFANYISDEPSNTPGHTSRLRWAQQTMAAPTSAAQMITPPTVMDSTVQAQGGAIDDAGLQTAVETTVNKML